MLRGILHRRNRIRKSGRVTRDAKRLLKHQEMLAASKWFHKNHESNTMKGIPLKDLSMEEIIDEFKLSYFRYYLEERNQPVGDIYRSWSDAESYLKFNMKEQDFY